MVVALGLYLAGLSHAVVRFERAGRGLWNRIAPIGRRYLPARTAGQAFALGTIWGWLPCGLVYSILVAAFASGSAQRGALTMLAFGLGTLPNLIALGYFSARLKPLLQHRAVRLTTGITVVIFGALGIAGTIFPNALPAVFCITR